MERRQHKPLSAWMRSSASDDGERAGFVGAAFTWMVLGMIRGEFWNAASTRWKKGATDGLDVFFVAGRLPLPTGVMRAFFTGGGARRSLRKETLLVEAA